MCCHLAAVCVTVSSSSLFASAPLCLLLNHHTNPFYSKSYFNLLILLCLLFPHLPSLAVPHRCVVTQACQNGNSQHLEHLLFYGADSSSQNASGNTALHICALYNKVDKLFSSGSKASFCRLQKMLQHSQTEAYMWSNSICFCRKQRVYNKCFIALLLHAH